MKEWMNEWMNLIGRQKSCDKTFVMSVSVLVFETNYLDTWDDCAFIFLYQLIPSKMIRSYWYIEPGPGGVRVGCFCGMLPSKQAGHGEKQKFLSYPLSLTQTYQGNG